MKIRYHHDHRSPPPPPLLKSQSAEPTPPVFNHPSRNCMEVTDAPQFESFGFNKRTDCAGTAGLIGTAGSAEIEGQHLRSGMELYAQV